MRPPKHAGAEAGRFTVCGLLSAAADYLVWRALCSTAGWGPVAALLVSRPVGGLVGFAGNRWWTWPHRRALTWQRQFTRFWLVWLAMYAIAAGIMELLARSLPNDRTLAWGLTGLAAALFGFLLQRTVAFR